MPGQGVLSLGITFNVAEYAAGGTLGTYAKIDDLQAIPSLGGEPEKVEVTTLADSVRRYINGIKDYGDLEFTFLYSNESANSSFRKIRSYEKKGKKVSVKIGIPGEDGTADQTTFVFDAVLSAGLNEAGVNDPLTFTVTAGLQSDIVISPDAT